MQNKYAYLCAILVSLFAVTYLTSCMAGNQIHNKPFNSPYSDSRGRYNKINVERTATKNGIFDISVEYGPDGTGWMAYSRVSLPKHVETQIAKSTNHGKSWKYVTTVNKSKDGYQLYGKRKHKGAWRHETPSLLYDPTDKPDRRWKLFYQKYLSEPPYKKGNSLFQNGWIEYKYAANPNAINLVYK